MAYHALALTQPGTYMLLSPIFFKDLKSCDSASTMVSCRFLVLFAFSLPFSIYWNLKVRTKNYTSY